MLWAFDAKKPVAVIDGWDASIVENERVAEVIARSGKDGGRKNSEHTVYCTVRNAI